MKVTNSQRYTEYTFIEFRDEAGREYNMMQNANGELYSAFASISGNSTSSGMRRMSTAQFNSKLPLFKAAIAEVKNNS